MTDIRTAIVTGASRGIGAAIAERLARDGMAVAINYSDGGDAAQALADRIADAGGQAVAIEADVADAAAIATMFDTVTERFGGVDALVNNAGIAKFAPLADSDDAMFDRQMAVNLKGVFNGMREAARRMRDGGRIVSLSSSVIGAYGPTAAVYAATKAGVEAMTHILAKELGARGITVNAVAPGAVETAKFLEERTKDQVDEDIKMIPLGRLGTPHDIARAVSFLIGPDGGWISGQVLRANGGVI